jgi:hypothetical protein
VHTPSRAARRLAWTYRLALALVAAEVGLFALAPSGARVRGPLAAASLGAWLAAGYLLGADDRLPRLARLLWALPLVVTCFLGAPVFVLWARWAAGRADTGTGAGESLRTPAPLAARPNRLLARANQAARWGGVPALVGTLVFVAGIRAHFAGGPAPAAGPLWPALTMMATVPVSLVLWAAMVYIVTTDRALRPAYRGGMGAVLVTTWLFGAPACAVVHALAARRRRADPAPPGPAAPVAPASAGRSRREVLVGG